MSSDSRLNKLLSAAGTFGSGPILKAIGKIAPGIGSFVSGAYTAGYAADQIVDFLRDRLTTPEQRRNLSQLKGRSEAGIARPDERAELVQHEQRMAPFEAAAGLGKLGAEAFGGVQSSKAESKQRALEIAQQQQAQEQRQQEGKQRQEEAAFKRERDTERDLERKNLAENRERRAATAEGRAAEKHKMAMEKAKQPKTQAQKAPSPVKAAKAAGTPPESYLDAIRELDELINRLS